MACGRIRKPSKGTWRDWALCLCSVGYSASWASSALLRRGCGVRSVACERADGGDVCGRHWCAGRVRVRCDVCGAAMSNLVALVSFCWLLVNLLRFDLRRRDRKPKGSSSGLGVN